MIDGEQDTIVYEILDYSVSLQYASEKLAEGFHVSTLIFTKDKPKTLLETVKQPEEIPLLGLI